MGLWELLYLASLLLGLGYLAMLAIGGQLGADHGDANVELDGGHDVHVEVEVDGDHDASAPHGQEHGALSEVSFFTPTVIATLLSGMGGVGLFSTLTLSLPWFLHLPLAGFGGWVVAYLVYLLYSKVIYPSQGSSHVQFSELWGTVAEVTTPIPSQRLGEIRFLAHGAYVATSARSSTGEPLPRGQLVIIESVENSVAIVRPTH